jgi:hypothetical protein
MATLLRNRSSLLTWALSSLLAAPAPGGASTAFLDAVLADVDRIIVTASDAAIARGLGLFGMEPSQTSIQTTDVQRLADAWLIDAEASRLQLTPTPEDVEEAWHAIAARLGAMGALRSWLDQAGLDEAWVRKLVEADLRQRRFIDVRFRAFVFVTEEDVTQAIGPGPHPPETRERAVTTLRDAAATRELATWLADARARAVIRYADIGAPGVPLPFSMPARVGP